jgi:hypothetical protein
MKVKLMRYDLCQGTHLRGCVPAERNNSPLVSLDDDLAEL